MVLLRLLNPPLEGVRLHASVGCKSLRLVTHFQERVSCPDAHKDQIGAWKGIPIQSFSVPEISDYVCREGK